MPATIVSIYPAAYNDLKPGLVPNSFEIPASEDAKTPTLTRLPDEIFRIKDIPLEENPDQQRILIPESHEVVARSVAWDFIRAARLNNTEQYPGIFFVLDNVYDLNQLERKYFAELETVREAQARWFEALVKEADDYWHLFRQFRSIDALHRIAAKFTGVKREWSVKIEAADLKKCRFCTSDINSAAIICPVCHQIVDPRAYNALKAEIEGN